MTPSTRDRLIVGLLWAIVMIVAAIFAIVVVTIATPDPHVTFDPSLTPVPVEVTP